MKIRRLSEIDLARFASHRDQERLESALRAYNAGGGAWSYDPVRQSTLDILAARTPLISIPAVSWPSIELQLARASKRGEIQAKANIQVGKVLFDAARSKGWSAANVEMRRLSIGLGESVRYWSDVVVQDSDCQFIPFFDHRRGRGIDNAPMLQVVFSMQNLWVRERNLDLMNTRLAVVKFPSTGKNRSICIEFHDDGELLSYEELDNRVRNVYETWARISDERTQETRRTGTDGTTPFGF